MPPYDPVARLKARELGSRLSGMTPRPAKDPLPDRGGSDTEADDRAELEAVRAQLKEADARIRDVSGEGFHCTLVFLSESQRDAFVAAVGWPSVEGGRYIDGVAAAAAMGVPLPAPRVGAISPASPDRKCVASGIIPGYPEESS